MRDAMNKYKKYGTGTLDIPAIPAFAMASQPVATRTSHTGSVNGKPRTHRRRSTQQKKNKALRDVTDMYAIGLSLTK